MTTTAFDFDPAVDSANYLNIKISGDYVQFQEATLVRREEVLTTRATLPASLWADVQSVVVAMLRQDYGLTKKGSAFKVGDNALPRMMGREVLVLAWALEELVAQGRTDRAAAVASNWAGMQMQTRWFLHMLANTPSNEDGLGWKKALFYGLAG